MEKLIVNNDDERIHGKVRSDNNKDKIKDLDNYHKKRSNYKIRSRSNERSENSLSKSSYSNDNKFKIDDILVSFKKEYKFQYFKIYFVEIFVLKNSI